MSSYKLTTSINLNKILKQKKIKKCISVPFPLGDKRVKSIQTVFSPEFLSKIHESRICGKNGADFQSRNFSKITSSKLEKKRRSLVKILMNKKFDVQSPGISKSLKIQFEKVIYFICSCFRIMQLEI